jgi:hypothetical protein
MEGCGPKARCTRSQASHRANTEQVQLTVQHLGEVRGKGSKREAESRFQLEYTWSEIGSCPCWITMHNGTCSSKTTTTRMGDGWTTDDGLPTEDWRCGAPVPIQCTKRSVRAIQLFKRLCGVKMASVPVFPLLCFHQPPAGHPAPRAPPLPTAAREPKFFFYCVASCRKRATAKQAEKARGSLGRALPSSSVHWEQPQAATRLVQES